jgi:hypothetical protein
MNNKDIDRFFHKVDKTKGCWNFLGAKNKFGHGMFSFNRKTIGAHRFSYEYHFNKIPNGLYVCHHCDNPMCVNPNHLFLGTAQDNILDAIAKGRINKKIPVQKKYLGFATPFGVFETRKQAARRLGWSPDKLTYRMEKYPSLFYYIRSK